MIDRCLNEGPGEEGLILTRSNVQALIANPDNGHPERKE